MTLTYFAKTGFLKKTPVVTVLLPKTAVKVSGPTQPAAVVWLPQKDGAVARVSFCSFWEQLYLLVLRIPEMISELCSQK